MKRVVQLTSLFFILKLPFCEKHQSDNETNKVHNRKLILK